MAREVQSFLTRLEGMLRESQQRNERRCQEALETLVGEGARDTLHAELDALRVHPHHRCAEEEARRHLEMEVSAKRHINIQHVFSISTVRSKRA